MKKNQILIRNKKKKEQSSKPYGKRRKIDTKPHIVCESIWMKSPEKANL